jgi:hypothetical protein
MKFDLRRAKNGWILKYCDDESPEEIVGLEDENDEHEAFRSFLYEIMSHYGPSDSKYSPKRLRIVALPGNDYEGPLEDEYRKELEDLRDTLDSILTCERNPHWK